MSDQILTASDNDVVYVGEQSTERPTLDREAVRREIEQDPDYNPDDLEAFLDSVEEDHNLSLEALAGRGPVTIDFGSKNLGYVNVFDIASGEGPAFYAVGKVVLGPWVDMIYANLAGLTPEQARTLPLGSLDNFDLFNGDDEVFRGLVDNEDLTRIFFNSRVSEAGAAEMRAEDEHCQLQASDHVVSDEAFARLAQAPRFTYIRVGDTAATDETIARVAAALPDLSALMLGTTVATGSFVASLAGREIEQLALTGPEARAAAMCAGDPLPSVDFLRVGGPNALEGLDPAAFFTTFPGLQQLFVGDGNVELAALLPLHAAKPELEINGNLLSRRAVEKAAAKLGVEL